MFVNGKSSIFAALAAILAACHFAQVNDPEEWKTEEIAVYTQNAQDLFDFVTDTANVPTYFAFVKAFTEDKPSQRISLGKQYTASMYVPLVGLKDEKLKVTGLKKNYYVTLKPISDTSSYFFQPVFTIKLAQIKPTKTRLTFHLHFDQKSMLFQCTLGQFMRFFMYQQFQHGLFTLRWILPRGQSEEMLE